MWAVRALGIAMVVLGVGLALLDTRTLPVFQVAIAQAFWGQPEMPPEVVTYHRFMHGALGGVIAGWGATVAVVAGSPRALHGVGVGLAVWFIVDTTASACFGAWPNVALNTACVALVGPLLFLLARRTHAAPS